MRAQIYLLYTFKSNINIYIYYKDVAWNPYVRTVNVGICGEDGGCDGICDCGYNLIWMITLGWIFFLCSSLLAIITLPLLCCGLDFSAQHWKLARLGLMPMGADIHKADKIPQAEI